MQVDLMNGMAYQEGTFNARGGTDSQNGENKLKEDVVFLLTQEKGKFYPDPEFGSKLQQYMFEPMTNTLASKIKTEIKTLIEKYYPQITLKTIDLVMNNNTHTISISIRYTYSDSEVDSETIELELFNKVS